MTDDLVKRLRALSAAARNPTITEDPLERAANQAADRIEQLVATTEALTAERDQWIQHAKNAFWADSEELELLTADNARLREALKGLMAHEPDYADTLWQEARAALTGKEPSHE
jgi:hypothetical protein